MIFVWHFCGCYRDSFKGRDNSFVYSKTPGLFYYVTGIPSDGGRGSFDPRF